MCKSVERVNCVSVANEMQECEMEINRDDYRYSINVQVNNMTNTNVCKPIMVNVKIKDVKHGFELDSGSGQYQLLINF